jgi:hypothetical protein
MNIDRGVIFFQKLNRVDFQIKTVLLNVIRVNSYIEFSQFGSQSYGDHMGCLVYDFNSILGDGQIFKKKDFKLKIFNHCVFSFEKKKRFYKALIYAPIRFLIIQTN